MPSPRVLILRAAGTNCDAETAFAFEKAGAQTNLVHVRALCQSPRLLQEHAILALPGGFSYGDDLGSGTVLANELVQSLSEPLRRFIDRGGLVLGICNGFQILVKTGLLPGPSYAPKKKDEVPGATLTFNDSQRFEDRWVYLRVEHSQSPFLEGETGKIVTFPVAHGEGKFMARDTKTLAKIEEGKQVAFRYVTANGSIAAYPENPNGAQNAIAGITDETGRVLGLMPHPERHVLPWQHPRWTREGLKTDGEGLFLFKNAVKHAKA
ncbi:MAG TPA: phosphoribosylformylglycinamidine synthase I [Planctomycetota bacterium]|nr:phosphoribosylformylglycinamidine synthase I [Planctomycetota bacterium]